MTLPVITIQAAFGSYPGDTSYAWTTISSYVRSMRYGRGRNNQLNEIEAGTGALTLKDKVSVFDRGNPASPFYPNVDTYVPIRAFATIAAVDYPMLEHYVERWPRTTRISSVYTERQISTVDGFSVLLADASIKATVASLTTAFGSNKDLTFTAIAPGVAGNAISIRYEVRSWGTPNVQVIGNDIAVRVNGTSDTAGSVKAALLAHLGSSELIDVALAAGSSGAGVVPEMATTFLAGGAGAVLPQELSGARIARMLDTAGVPAALRLLSTGKKSIAGETIAIDSTEKVLQHIQDVAESEDGLVFVDAAGRVVFLDSHTLLTEPYASTVATFSDEPAAGEIGYVALFPSDEAELLFNEWVGNRVGGTPQVAIDPGSVDRYRRRSQSLELKLATDNAVRDRVQAALARFKDPMDRVEAIAVKPGHDLDVWVDMLTLEIGDRVEVVETPPGFASPKTGEYQIQQIEVSLPTDLTDATFRLGLWPADISDYLILNHADRGRLDFNKLAA